eukprot:7431234-Alexandrium_andersonii.AAC.1
MKSVHHLSDSSAVSGSRYLGPSVIGLHFRVFSSSLRANACGPCPGSGGPPPPPYGQGGGPG